MFNLSLHLIGLYGGIVLYLISILMFESFKPRIVNLIFFGLACVPGLGLILMTGILLWQIFSHDRQPYLIDMDERCFCDIIVRRSKLNRWLFNDIDWKHWDNINAQQKETVEKSKQL